MKHHYRDFLLALWKDIKEKLNRKTFSHECDVYLNFKTETGLEVVLLLSGKQTQNLPIEQ